MTCQSNRAFTFKQLSGKAISSILTVLILIFVITNGGFTFAAGSPIVTTLSATGVTATSAVLSGSVNPNGLVTVWDFAGWSTGMSPGDRIIYCGGPDLPGDTANHLVSCQANGLTPSTTYWYRIRASNSASTGAGPHGTDVSFTTLPATATTDWAVTSVGIRPHSPQVGDQLTLGATVIVLSTTGGYPQNFVAQCILDGSSCGSGTLTYPGPTGVAFTVTSASTWIATAGAHTLSWQVSTTNDPNPGNNFDSYSFSVAAPTPFDFDIAVSPNSLTVQPGQTQSATVNVNLKSGTAQAVSLTVSGQPAGVTAALNPTSGTPTFSSTMTIAVSGTASPGTYTLSLSGSGGGQSHSAPFVLTVSMAPDFRIDLSPASQSAPQGQTSSYSINVVGSNGFNSQVSLSVTGLPPGANGVFSTSSGAPTFPSTLTVTLSNSAASGSYTLVIHGTGGGLDRTASAVLTVTAVTTQTQTTSQTTTTATVGLVEMLQQNSLLLIAALAILVIVLAALAMRGRGRPAGPQAMGASQVFCGRCGTANPLANEFCSNCGSRLKGSTGAA